MVCGLVGVRVRRCGPLPLVQRLWLELPEAPPREAPARNHRTKQQEQENNG